MDVREFDQLLMSTRAVRRRLDLTRPMERAMIVECLRIAIQAPTASNRHRWRWVVVTDPDIRCRLAELYRDVGAASLRRDRDSASGQTRRVYESAIYLSDHLQDVPVHVIPCRQGRIEAGDNAAAAAFYGSIVPAAWSFALALRARGLGTAWTTLHLGREREAAALLGIPDDVTQIALLPVAYTVGQDLRSATRPPVKEVVVWDSWGQLAQLQDYGGMVGYAG
jgi:nitroreductase